jgi:hypothetical protein
MKNNIFVIDASTPAPGKVVITEFLHSEFTFGAFHVGDILCIQQVNFRILRREINLPYPSDPNLSLYLFVEKVGG